MKTMQVMRGTLFLLCLLFSIMLLNACGGSGEDPQTVTDHYYAAMEKDDYNTAIKYLQVTTAPNPTMNVTTSGELQTQEQAWGRGYPIKSYKINSQSVNGQNASVNVTITRAGGGSSTMNVYLSQVNGTWIITGGDNPQYLY